MRKFALLILNRNAYFLLASAWLFTIAFIINNYYSGASSAPYLQSAIQKRIRQLETQIDVVARDTVQLKVFSEGTYTEQQLRKLIDLDFGIYLYKPAPYQNWSLAFWSNQQSEPNAEVIYAPDTRRLVSLRNGQYEYVRKLVPLARDSLLLIALVPIRTEYFIQNSNLQKQFVNFPQAENSVSLLETETQYPVRSIDGSALFYLEPKNRYAGQSANEWALLLEVLGVILLLIIIHNIATAICETYGVLRGILFLMVTIFFLRAMTYWFKEGLSWRAYDLFDPSIYSSNAINSSLGDLLINAFLFSWLLFFVNRKTYRFSLAEWRGKLLHWPIVAAGALMMVVITFVLAAVVQSLIADARISFNVTNFFSLDRYSFFGFVVLAMLALSYFLASTVIMRLLQPLLKGRSIVFYALMALFGLMMITFIEGSSLVELNIYVLLWLIGYIWLMRLPVVSSVDSRWSISVLLLWIFLYSVSISLIIIAENSRIELEQRKRTAEKLSLQADPTSERLLSIALTYFDNDFLYANFDRFRVESSNHYLKDSLINKNFSAYLNKYDTRIYTFDAAEKPLYNDNSVSYDTLNTIFRIEGKPTNVADMRYFEKSFDKFSYISRKMITDSAGVAVGFMFVLSEPKKYKSDALVPELFRARKDFLPDEYSPIYSYAIYNNRELVDYYNDYAFPTRLSPAQVPKASFTRRQSYNYDELWYRDDAKVVVIARRDNLWLESMTLVAYLFTTFLVLLGLFRLAAMLVRSRLRLSLIRKEMQLNLRTQVHGTIIFISLFSFLVIGAATIFFFINRYNKNKQDQLSKAIQIMTNEVQSKISSRTFFDYMLKLYEEGQNEILESLVQEVSEIHGTDINIYDTNGELRLSSNPFIYDKGILSVRMNPEAYFMIHRKRLVQVTTEEQMGGISYQSIYSPVRDDQGNAYAYLNMPSFDSQVELKKEISNFLVTIINLNAFIFLFAGVIALFITNRITSSFSLISEKMRAVSLGQHNDEIEWHRDDEIGELVTEYNKMVLKLEESAAALAKSEREGAWREMARQVAHEIKNPLTPMKLSIQYLQKATDANTGDVKQLTANVARTLVEQIDHLSKIASEFSQFANISMATNEVFDLHEILYSLSHLYNASEQVRFSWIPVNHKLMVNADRTQLNRLFTNLLQNAVEATINDDDRMVRVLEEAEDHKVLVSISDNGHGIPEAMRSKIFTPNFTTKSSGTGLGLAMSKGIVEQAKGRIWFETSEGQGTTFFVELPLINEQA
ncbi:sensor histidine kinase [Flavihumibacter petaseus]|uniref:histidine kinase n=1 Tax=Flavihumibacter petaseus NBRC 106054 TaxID=1220578 RepID=A0A0E9N1E3_9BACT|nr:MFS domain-containing histidine kinase [Flavihumibacter petaseus]GAO43155.1 putative two-component histidine kinase [Flavihumibacter petaseus NBRC 106054]